jgi:hypothetical protein
MFFANEVRPKVILENPRMDKIEIVSIIANKWKNTSEEDSKKYDQLAAADKIICDYQRNQRMITHMDKTRKSVHEFHERERKKLKELKE